MADGRATPEPGRRWEDALLALFDDLEQQAEGLHLQERDVQVAERGRAEYRTVELAERLCASVGASLTLQVSGLGQVAGELVRSGVGWSLLAGPGATEWLVVHGAVTGVAGAVDRSVARDAWPVMSRLGVTSAISRISDDRQGCLLCFRDGRQERVLLGRVGADFVEYRAGDPERRPGPPMLAAFAGIAALRTG